ncbi:MAG: polymer-forming cytoskeletal protein [Alphaproteobacteria bacterium]
MFSRGNGKGRRDSARGDGVEVPPSIVSADMRIVGNVTSSGEIQIDGSVEGDIRCVTLIIGVSGSIQGEVDADVARIHGGMSGQLRAKSVFLASSARMIGNVTHQSLAIEPGAVMNGHCRHMDVVPDVPPEVEAEVVVPEKNLMIVDSTIKSPTDRGHGRKGRSGRDGGSEGNAGSVETSATGVPASGSGAAV